MKVVVTTKDFCEEARHYLESEGFEVVLRNRLGIGAGAPDDILYPVVEDACRNRNLSSRASHTFK